jgi:hypothetical protein
MLSWAAISASFHCNVNVRTPGYSSHLVESQIMDLGIHPVFKKKGVYPVAADRDELIANSIAGNLLTQSFCLASTH